MSRRHHSQYIEVDGEPVEWPDDDVLGFGQWMQTADRHVDWTELEGGAVKVSTVFLGLNHQYGDGPPVLYETMIFGGEHDELQARYHTRAEAAQGHADVVNLLESYYSTGKRQVKNGNGK